VSARTPHGEVYSTFELIREFGSRSTEKSCSCCKQYTLYAIRYPDGRGTAYLCAMCDVEHDLRV
jgi:hypothetical protein